MKARRLSQDILDVFGSRAAVALIGMATGILLARNLGPHDRGILALVLLLPSTLMTVTKLGMTQANVYCVRREGAPAAHAAANSLVLALGLSAVCAALVWLLRDVLLDTVMRGVPVWALLLAVWRVPLLLIDNFFNGVLQALGNFTVYNRRTMMGAALLLAMCGTLAVAGRLDLTAAVWIYTISTTVVIASLLLKVRYLVPFGVRPDTPLLRRQLRFGLKSYVQILSTHLLFRADVYMVSYFLNPVQTAFYSLALHFTEMILEIPQAVGWVLYPRLASVNKDEVHRLTAQACRRTILLTGVAGLGVVLVGPFLITLWYGKPFADAAKPLPLIVLGILMMAVFTILSRDFTSRNKQAVNIRAGATALVANIGLNIYTIPAMGIVGAALATAMSYTLASVILIVAYRRDSGVALREVVIPTGEDVRFVWSVTVQKALQRVAGRRRSPAPAVAPGAGPARKGRKKP